MTAPRLKTLWAGAPSGIERVDNVTTAMPKGNVQGDPSARVALIEFSDFQCPFCGKYARETLPLLVREFVEARKVRYGYRHFPLSAIHPFAQAAGKAAQCAGDQRKFWEMHHRLFAEPLALAPDDLLGAAEDLRLDRVQFDACLKAPAPALEEDVAEAKRLGIMSTPTFLVGIVQPDGHVHVTTKVNGAQTFTVFRNAVVEAIRLSSR